MHEHPHPLAGQTVKIKHHPDNPHSGPVDFRVEDYWDRMTEGVSLADALLMEPKNWAAHKYAERRAREFLPQDDEILYGKVGFGHAVHVSEVLG